MFGIGIMISILSKQGIEKDACKAVMYFYFICHSHNMFVFAL